MSKKTRKSKPQPIGAIGLPYAQCGAVLQEVASTLIDRGHDAALVAKKLREADIDEEFWDQWGGPIVDWLEDKLNL